MSLPESFRVYKKKVTVMIDDKEETYELLPLKGEFYSKFLSLFKGATSAPANDPKLSEEENARIAGEAYFASLSEDDFKTYHMLILETLASSYGASREEIKNLDLFVSKNLIALMPILATVNLPDKG